MKKFSKMLALGLALVMTMGMTVSAAENSENTSNSNAATEALAATTTISGAVVGGVTVSAQPEITVPSAESLTKVEAVVKELPNEGYEGTLVGAIDIEYPALTAEQIASGVTVTVKANVSADKTYVVLHVLDNGNMEVLNASVTSDGYVSFTTKSFSPFYVLEMKEIDDDDDDDDDDAAEAVTATGEVASPKTGETLPVAGMMLVICLAGAAVCAKKVRYNN